MVDLVGMAYGTTPDKVVGGPNWLEMDRFDVIAKVPDDFTEDARKPMLRALLEDRFKRVAHQDTRPVPALALSVGKKPQLKEAAGTEQAGCKPQTDSGAPGERSGMFTFTRMSGGQPTTFRLGSGMTIQYQCRNLTMEAFAAGLPNYDREFPELQAGGG